MSSSVCLRDEPTGLTIELGRLVSFSSDCFVVNIFEEQGRMIWRR